MAKPPADHDDSPDLTAADFARARWAADGTPISPVNRARLDLIDAVEALDEEAKRSEALRQVRAKMKSALADLDKAS